MEADFLSRTTIETDTSFCIILRYNASDAPRLGVFVQADVLAAIVLRMTVLQPPVMQYCSNAT